MPTFVTLVLLGVVIAVGPIYEVFNPGVKYGDDYRPLLFLLGLFTTFLFGSVFLTGAQSVMQWRRNLKQHALVNLLSFLFFFSLIIIPSILVWIAFMLPSDFG